MRLGVASTQQLFTSGQLNKSTSNVSTSMERLSSGLRINSAQDDAAGLQLSNRQSKYISGLAQANRNAADSISLTQVAEGALGETNDALFGIRDLILKAENGSLSQHERAAIQQQVSAYLDEVKSITDVKFGDQGLFDGNFGSKSFQVGANNFDTVNLSLPDFNVESFKPDTDVTGIPEIDNFADVEGVAPESELIIVLDISGSMGGALSSIQDNMKDLIESYSQSTVSNTKIGFIAYGNGLVHSIKPPTLIDVTGTEELNNFVNSLSISGGNERLDIAFAEAQGLFTPGTDIAKELIVVASRDDEINDIQLLTYYDGNPITPSPQVDDAFTNAQTLIDSGVNISTIQVNSTGSSTYPFVQDLNALPNNQGSVQFSANGSDIDTLITNKLNELSDKTLQIAENNGDLYSIDVTNRTSNTVSNGMTPIWLAIIDNAIDKVSSVRADLGAVMNRLESILNVNSVSSENLSASRSRILDTNYVTETAELTKQQIIQESGTAMMAQANQISESILQLLGN